MALALRHQDDEALLLIPDTIAQLAERLADASGAVLRRYYRTNVAVDAKADDSPVTLADREAEALLRELIRAIRPADVIIGEEYGTDGEDPTWTWVLDPIDGTRAFITGRPLFGTLIGVLYEGRPVIGVIDLPITGDRWVGVADRPTLFNGRPCRTRACADLGQAYFATTSPDLFPSADVPLFEQLRDATRQTIYGGDCCNYGYLASGFLDVVAESGLKLHDFAALAPVIEGAGGAIVDWSGRPLTAESDGRVLAVGDARLLKPILG
ncbi:MAG: histidinol phosphate phosphatase [Sphingomonadales bacterium]|nr:MAG: histidinol phosphate phosphatase [Sphingomonadales bacterium]